MSAALSPAFARALICLALVLLTACGPRGQAATAAGIDADHNGIRDDVDTVIAKEFQESPAQTIYAQRLARVMQVAATTENPTREQAIDYMKTFGLQQGCLGYNTPEELVSRKTSILVNATFNIPERAKNRKSLVQLIGSGRFSGTREDDCKL